MNKRNKRSYYSNTTSGYGKIEPTPLKKNSNSFGGFLNTFIHVYAAALRITYNNMTSYMHQMRKNI